MRLKIQDVTALFETEDRLRIRARQQSAIADLGHMALTETGLFTVYDAPVETITETLEIDLCEMLQLLPDQQLVKLIAGIGCARVLVAMLIGLWRALQQEPFGAREGIRHHANRGLKT